jgi:predicted protein tyrosine phosphatase
VDEKLKVLFVCSLNKWRSATAEVIYRNHPQLEVRSAGTRSNANRHISSDDISWANVIFVMEREHKQWIQEHHRGLDLPKIEVLDIPDDLVYMDPELQALLKRAIDPELAALLKP